MFKTRMGYDSSAERFAFINKDGYIQHFHCGDSFEVKISSKWYPTRIEMGHCFDDGYEWKDWYLCGVHDGEGNTIQGAKLRGLEIRW